MSAAAVAAAWSMFFGCKASPSLFDRGDARRVHVASVFYTRFLDVFPEIAAHHPRPQGSAAMAFAILRGTGLLELFDVGEQERQGSLDALAEAIVQEGTPQAGGGGGGASTSVTPHPLRSLAH